MREDLLTELETEYDQIRAENERTENARKEKIHAEQPEIYELVRERQELVYSALRMIVSKDGDSDNLPEKMMKLTAEIREKLTNAGFPSDYLAPVYRCPLCKDTGKVGELIKEPCECFKKAYQRKLREKIGLKSDRQETFETFNLCVFPDEALPGKKYSQRKLMEMRRKECEEWSDSYSEAEHQNLLLTGKSGLGKTFLLHAIAERLIERDVNVLIISAYKMLEIVRKAYFSNEGTADEIADAEVLMIDDLGSEPLMQNVTVEQLFNLLNERQNRRLSTIISTNLTMDEIKNRYTERIASRLRARDNWKVITLEGKDSRS